MERPWLLLRRVLDVGLVGDIDDDLHADADDGEVVDGPEVDAEEHAAVAEEEADAQALHAGVGEAEEHVVAMDVAAEAQAQHAAVAEAEEHAMAVDAAAQAQHAAVDEAEEGAQGQEDEHDAFDEEQDEEEALAQEGEHDAVLAEAQDEEDALAQEGEHAGAEEAEEHDDAQIELEESVVDVNTAAQESAEAHAAMFAFDIEPDFAIKVARPPRASSLTAGLHSHPDPERPDMYPYIIAAGPFCLLVHYAVAPSHGTNFAHGPEHSHLVVVRHFLRADDGEIAACAVNVPHRPVEDFLDMPPLSNIESVGLVCDQETSDYQIAELIVTTGAPDAVVVCTRSDTGIWEENDLVNPLLPVNCLRDWVPHGTVTINSTVLWYDLSWGIISCDLAQPPGLQVLNFHRLPPGRVLHAGAGVPDLHCRRCIAVSENLVRYVEIILDDPNQASTVNMWFRDVEDNPWRWDANYSVSFEHIWDHESYAQTELPRNIPVIVGVSPVDSRVVYFSLNQRLFGVNVPEHMVVDCQQYEPLHRPGPPDEPDTSRYFVTWNLDDDGAPNVGYQPDDPSDHGDSSGSGPADEGEIDYTDLGDSSGSGPADEGEIDSGMICSEF